MIDVDGYSSSAQIYLYLHELNPNINIIPLFHHNKLHGLDDEEIMQTLLASEPSLLIIPDASGSEDAYERAVGLGYEILCIDHHQTKPSQYVITINNQHSDGVNKQGAGAEVVFQFLRALDNAFNVRFANHYIDLCAIGNIGDVMDMANPYNRTLNYYGLKNITNPFLKVLCNKFVKGELTPHTVAFNIVPKFNAVIRSDDNELKEDLFRALTDTHGAIDLDAVADRCDKCHQSQKRVVKKIADALESELNGDEKVIVVQTDEYQMPDSYTGLIAGKISGDYNKPCIILKNNGIGSCRSPIPILTILRKCDAVDWAEGHDLAFGIKVSDINRFRAYCDSLYITADVVHNVIYSGTIDSIPRWLYGYFDRYEDLFGRGIEEPQFHICGIQINSKSIRTIGNNKTTLKFEYKGIEFIYFYANSAVKSDLHIDSKTELKIEVIGKLNINEWGNNKKPQIIIDKIEAKENKVTLADLW